MFGLGKNVSNTVKYASVIAVIIFLIIVFFYVKNYLKRKKGQEDAKKQIEKIGNDIQEENLTLELSRYSVLAGNLKTALSGWGEDEEAVYDIFKELKTDDDVQKVMFEFGVYKDMTLTQWITEYFNKYERDTLNSILAQNDISYRF